ncbi:MAG: hypothetical protein LIO81_01320 [Clostridiales bacterium]|nr:hypothetical protein [Clostridiales bacterium]
MMRRWIARILIVAMLAAALPMETFAAMAEGVGEAVGTLLETVPLSENAYALASGSNGEENYENASGSNASKNSASKNSAGDGNENGGTGTVKAYVVASGSNMYGTATSANATSVATASNAAMLSMVRSTVDTSEYYLEGEETAYASYDDGSSGHIKNYGIGLQSNGYVTFDLSNVNGFADGKFLISANINGNNTTLSIKVNGNEKGSFSTGWYGWGESDLREYYYHGIIELGVDDELTIAETTSGMYNDVDWVRLQRVDDTEVFWIEAEDTSVTTLTDCSGIYSDDNDRVKIESGESLTFNLKEVNDFISGTYSLYAGLNGERQYFQVSVDDIYIGNIEGLMEGKYEIGTCRDCEYTGEDLELGANSTVKLSGSDSWGHVDYIRLVRTGDLKPMFDETDPDTGIRVVAEQGVLPEGTTIVVKSVGSSDQKTLREVFAEYDQKAYFYRFYLANSTGSEIDLSELDGEVTAYFPIPDGYSSESAVYYAEDADDTPTVVTGYEESNNCLKIQLDAYGIYMIVDADSWQLEGEEHYTGNSTNGGTAADLQPSESIDFTIPVSSGFESGVYNLYVYVCGYQNYTVSVNGGEIAAIDRGDGTDWGDFELCLLPAVLTLRASDTVTLTANDTYGWVDYILLVPCEDYEEEFEDAGVTALADAGVIPTGSELEVEPADESTLEWIRDLFGISEADTLPMSFWNASLTYDGEEIDPAGKITFQVEIPEEVDVDELAFYQISGDGRKTVISYMLSSDGSYLEFTTDILGLFGYVVGVSGDFYYYGSDYYAKLTGSENQYADLQPREEMEFCVGDAFGLADGNYILTLRSSGTRTKLMVKVNGVVVGMLSRENTDWEDMNDAVLDLVLSLTPEDVIAIYAPGTEDLGPYGWVDYVKLTATDQAADTAAAVRTKITLQAEDYWPDELEEDGQVANLNNPAKMLEIPLLASCGFPEDETEYLFTMYTTGTMRSYEVYVNGELALTGELDGSGYEMQYMVKVVGSETLALKAGDILEIAFPEQDSDNYGNWVDYIILNSRRKASDGSLEKRTGGCALTETIYVNSAEPTLSVENGALIYQAEAYYKAQNDNPAADLQPGEQIPIPVSEHWKFVDGSYRLTIRSCGNRELFNIKVNGVKVASVSRKESNYGMDQMSDDGGAILDLKAGDILIVEGQTGGKYGWVDYVSLTPVTRSEPSESGKRYSWEAENYYQKQTDTPTADLQPGETIDIPLGDNEEFVDGTYYIQASSNGNRTMLSVKVNGALVGSITRNETNFTMDGMTLDVLQRPVALTRQDVISLCAPGTEEGPWGWVDQLVLVPADEANPTPKEEYRYPAAAYGTASTFLAAADLQPEESLVIPLSDQAEFTEGDYRVFVISNGTREEFAISLNGGYVGAIRRSASDYGDNGMSADQLPDILHLTPADILTVTGQAGDHYGWVSALLLERVE